MSEIPLQCSLHSSAVVVPARPRTRRPWRGSGGVFDQNGCFDFASRLVRDYDVIVDAPAACPAAPDLFIDRECIFAGYLVAGHFGHFLLESCARLWYAKTRPDLPIVWAYGDDYLPFNRAVLEILGIRNQPIFVDRPVRIAKLHVPSVGYRIRDAASGRHLEFMAVWEGRVQPVDAGGDRIWLSRAKLPSGHGGIEEESEIVEVLAARGWTIYEPEKHPLRHQLQVLAGARHVAGFMGSAFHSLLLLKRFSGRITMFSRGRVNENFCTIARGRGFDQRIIELDLNRSRGQGANTTWSLTDQDALYRALEIERNHDG